MEGELIKKEEEEKVGNEYRQNKNKVAGTTNIIFVYHVSLVSTSKSKERRNSSMEYIIKTSTWWASNSRLNLLITSAIRNLSLIHISEPTRPY